MWCGGAIEERQTRRYQKWNTNGAERRAVPWIEILHPIPTPLAFVFGA